MTEYIKDFPGWHKHKEKIHAVSKTDTFFHEREVWWCCVGVNVGFEQDGKDEEYARPVLILRQFNLNLFWGVPLSTTPKEHRYYYKFKATEGVKAGSAILTQLKLMDSKRLTRKMGVLEESDFEEVRRRIKDLV